MTPKSIRYTSLAALAGALVLSEAHAQAGGQPLILDTQTGIHSGAPGNVLQTGPITGSGMVQARPMAKLQELPQQDQQTTIVSPYISVQPPGQGTNSQTRTGTTGGTQTRASRPAQNAYALQQGNESAQSSTGLVPSRSSGGKRGLSTSGGQGGTTSTGIAPK